MDRTGMARRIGRGLMVVSLAVSVGAVTSPGTAYAKHGSGAAVALSILGGPLAGAAIASSAPPGYYAAPPAYHYPPAPPVYSAVPAPVYSYVRPRAVHYSAVPYYGPRFHDCDDD